MGRIMCNKFNMTGFLLIVLLVSNQAMTVVKLCNLKDGEFNIRSSGCLKQLLTELRSNQSNQEQIQIKIHGPIYYIN